MRFLQRSQVLEAVREHAKGRKITAAVAYLGDGAADLLPVKAGDFIVVNGSMNALANGATSARLLRQWYEQDVQLYVHETLHAKVFVVGRTAFVGSANLSARARRDGTVEAAIQTADSAIVAEARAFVHGLKAEATLVSDAWLQWAEAVPVRGDRGSLWNPAPPFTPRVPYDLWIGSEDKADWSEDERALAGEGHRIHRVPGGRYETVVIAEDRRDPNRLEEPDMVVLVRARSTQLLRFLARRQSRRAAVGFYRLDRKAQRVPLIDVAEALDLTVTDMRVSWFRVSGQQRAALIELFGLPDLSSRQE